MIKNSPKNEPDVALVVEPETTTIDEKAADKDD